MSKHIIDTGITMDIMIETLKEGVTYQTVLDYIDKYTYREMLAEPKAIMLVKRFWKEKQELTKEFVRRLTMNINIV